MTDNRLTTKAERVRQHMRAGKYREALALANSFGRLGEQSRAIRTAHDALNHRAFYVALGKDVDGLVAAGIDALHDRYLPHGTDPSEVVR